MSTDTYGSDVSFLKEYTEIVQMNSHTGAAIAIAPEWQRRVMTSTLNACRGASFTH